MSKYNRRELKYFVPIAQAEPIRHRLEKQMSLDPFCCACENGQYCVRSIYFDTSRMLFYHEKIEGLKVRKKLRVRVYNSLEPNSIAFLEIKRKIDNTVYKERARVPIGETPNLTNGAQLQLLENPANFAESTALEKFRYLTKRLNLTPKVLITYEREAYYGLDDPTLRVTLDKNMRCYPLPSLEEIYREENLQRLSDRYIILEIKFNGRMLVFLRNLVRDFHLRVQAISKYCHGIDIHYSTFK